MIPLDTSPIVGPAPRRADSHKGDYGHILLVGGSLGMSGAITLSALAALRSGAGLVTVAVPESVLPTVAAAEPSYMTWPLPCNAHGQLTAAAAQALAPLWEKADVLAVGPGLGRSEAAVQLVRHLYAEWPKPMVVDADGLYALAGWPAATLKPRLLTPHPGEFLRLCPDAPRERSLQEEAAVTWACEHRVVLILKGAPSLVTDGRRAAYNPTGNPGMATGGSGDVLTGIAAAVLAWQTDLYQAARLAAYVHGLAGDLAARRLGQVALIASDLVRYLPAAWKKLARTT
ncbi:MAG: hypothetical protein KatS3mg110_1326 [Pirellulaceae bacterium]|nr:MAG: hypothetical protein KatS3mg110_1326 [Pirellulaceae bacterium]